MTGAIPAAAAATAASGVYSPRTRRNPTSSRSLHYIPAPTPISVLYAEIVEALADAMDDPHGPTAPIDGREWAQHLTQLGDRERIERGLAHLDTLDEEDRRLVTPNAFGAAVRGGSALKEHIAQHRGSYRWVFEQVLDAVVAEALTYGNQGRRTLTRSEWDDLGARFAVLREEVPYLARRARSDREFAFRLGVALGTLPADVIAGDERGARALFGALPRTGWIALLHKAQGTRFWIDEMAEAVKRSA